MTKPAILVVDDEPALRAMVERTLEAEGYPVVLAGDGLEAWGLIEEDNGPFGLLIIDLMMPRLDGPTLIRRVRARLPAQRILIITGHLATDLADGPARNIPVLLKPFSHNGLLTAVRTALQPRGKGAPIVP